MNSFEKVDADLALYPFYIVYPRLSVGEVLVKAFAVVPAQSRKKLASYIPLEKIASALSIFDDLAQQGIVVAVFDGITEPFSHILRGR